MEAGLLAEPCVDGDPMILMITRYEKPDVERAGLLSNYLEKKSSKKRLVNRRVTSRLQAESIDEYFI